jgi:UDP-N-acetyl-D-glucosamine dehydrogenase
VDPLYLSWRLTERGQPARFIELADSVNRSMPGHVVERALAVLARGDKSATGARVLVYGVTYKRGVPDTRESPAFAVIRGLRGHGAHVFYMDPLVRSFVVDGAESPAVDTDEPFSDYDLVVVLTDHAELDRVRLLREAPAILDTRDALAGVPGSRAHVFGL